MQAFSNMALAYQKHREIHWHPDHSTWTV